MWNFSTEECRIFRYYFITVIIFGTLFVFPSPISLDKVDLRNVQSHLLNPKRFNQTIYKMQSLSAIEFPSKRKDVLPIQSRTAILYHIDSHHIRDLTTAPLNFVLNDLFLTPKKNEQPRWVRLAMMGTLASGAIAFLYREFNTTFGSPNRKFRLGSDWTSDNAMQLDEFLHFTGSYHLTQGLTSLLRWGGIPENRALLYSVLSAGTFLTIMEILDGTRSSQPASITDFVSNFAGLTFAALRPKIPALRKIEFSITTTINLRTLFSDRAHFIRYDRVRAWISYSLQQEVDLPLSIGLGFGLNKPFKDDVSRDFYFGFGLNLADLFPNNNHNEIGNLDWLGFYRISPSLKL
jgi:hypothetical protein